MLTKTVDYVTDLSFGNGNYTSLLTTHEQKEALAEQLGSHTGPITQTRLADCVDFHLIVGFSHGAYDLDRTVWQQPGGTYLHIAKAASAANLAIVAEAKDLIGAYGIIDNVMTSCGWQDAGHKVCGASKNAQRSVAEPLAPKDLLVGLDLVIGKAVNPNQRQVIISKNETHKRQLLENGFYGTWSNGYHEGRLYDRVPQNFATLESTGQPSGLLVVHSPSMGLIRPQLVEATGHRVFAATTSQYDEITHLLCSTEDEKARMQVALADDLLTVAQTLIKPGLPVFA